MAMEKFRADHIGSLLRPTEMLDARRAYDQGKITWEQLREASDKACLKAIEVQKQSGIGIYTDGEYRRAIWSGSMRDAVEGLVLNPDATLLQPGASGWQGPYAQLATATLHEVSANRFMVNAKLKMVRSVHEDEAAFLKKHAPGPWKITLAAVNPGVQWFKNGVTDKFYPTREALAQELLGFRQAELKKIMADGCKYVQLDSLAYTAWMNPSRRKPMTDQGLDLEKELDKQIAWDNQSIPGVRGTPGVTVGHHICRGNNRSAWGGEGPYDAVAEKLFTTMNVDRFLLEYDTERAGGFEPLRFVPKDKMVVLGIISSKLAELESVDSLRRRIDDAAKYCPLDNLAISPQCGFASTMPGNILTWDDQKRKLELIVETARKVWG